MKNRCMFFGLIILVLFMFFPFISLKGATRECLYFTRDSDGYTRYIIRKVVDGDVQKFTYDYRSENDNGIDSTVLSAFLDNYNNGKFAILERVSNVKYEDDVAQYNKYTCTPYASLDNFLIPAIYYHGEDFDKPDTKKYKLVADVNYNASDYVDVTYTANGDNISVRVFSVTGKLAQSGSKVGNNKSGTLGSQNHSYMMCPASTYQNQVCGLSYFASSNVYGFKGATTGIEYVQKGGTNRVYKIYSSEDELKNIYSTKKGNICEIGRSTDYKIDYFLTSKTCEEFIEANKKKDDGGIVEEKYENCEEILGSNVVDFINKTFALLKIAVCVITLVLSSYEFFMAIPSNDEGALKKAFDHLKKRLILIIVVFLLPVLINVLFSLVAGFGGFGKDGFTCGIK